MTTKKQSAAITKRKATMVRNAQARAQITARLRADSSKPKTLSDIHTTVSGILGSEKETLEFLNKMVASDLVREVAPENPEDDRTYVLNNGTELPIPEDGRRKRRKLDEEEPIDIKVNKKERKITIRYAGLVVSLSRED